MINLNKIAHFKEPKEKPCERSTSDQLLVRMASLTSVASEVLTGKLYLGACPPPRSCSLLVYKVTVNTSQLEN